MSSTWAQSSVTQATLCDVLTAHPDDPNRVAPPVMWNQRDPMRAVPACEASVRQDPNSPRLRYQLGLAQDSARNFTESFSHYTQAANRGYVAAGLAHHLGATHVGIKECVQVNADDGWMAVWQPAHSDSASEAAAAETPDDDDNDDAPARFVFDGGEEEDDPVLTRPRVTATPRPAIMDDKDVACDVRPLFADGNLRSRDEAIRGLALSLGYQRVGANIREQMNSALLAAARRGILLSSPEGLALTGRSIRDYDRPMLEKQFLASLAARAWKDQDEAILDFARWLGFARTGNVITETTELVIRSLIRQGRLERDRRWIRRAP